MSVKKILKRSLLYLAMFLPAMSTSVSGSTEKNILPEWRVSISSPSLYPAKVTSVYGVNHQENWISQLHAFSQFMSKTDMNNVMKWINSYDGYGLPLHTFTMVRGAQVSKRESLPDDVYLYWTSLANIQFYVTRFDLNVEIKRLMVSKDSYVGRSGDEISCYRSEIVFGLLPNGQAKVFLKGCGELIYVTELKPESVMREDAHGFNAEDYRERSYFKRIQKRADEIGAVLDPIPWDKVNKVYSNEKVTELN
ncbi:DUF2931 family protein [Vibrio aquaticus]|uniref:DUF2931 family protein n=1 Tax=Vibrio aquaticus TaxID=2496559 RepID=A0A3S0MKZ9_9VIBR|nr:DUF2931 family protein [Vibrio aquaticus]RTZ16725.1 DUF2931 family protein [Vibrio aquaticus]